MENEDAKIQSVYGDFNIFRNMGSMYGSRWRYRLHARMDAGNGISVSFSDV
jgi:hypothetical protein